MTTLVPVKSSNIAAIGYDAPKSELHVKFNSGDVHVYSAVTPAKHADLMKAKSVGSHFHQHIRNAHKSVKRA